MFTSLYYQFKIFKSRGSVRAGATGAIAPVDFQKTPFAPANFPNSLKKYKIRQFKTRIGTHDNDLHPLFETH